jgi:hypothetical protein
MMASDLSTFDQKSTCSKAWHTLQIGGQENIAQIKSKGCFVSENLHASRIEPRVVSASSP